MTICIAGKNNIAVKILEYFLENHKYNLIVVCNKTDDGLNGWQKSLRFVANKRKIVIRQLNEIYDIPDLLFLSLEFDQIIKPELFISNRLYNVHFSLLPSYKGMFTSVMPILHGEKKSGVTLHRIDAGIDTGDIIDQISFQISQTDTARMLYEKYIDTGINIVMKNISELLTDNMTSIPQPVENASYFSKKTIDFNNIHIDFKKTAWEIHNQIRAFIFREYQLPAIAGFKIYKSKISSISSNKKSVGGVKRIAEHIMQINAIDYIVYAFVDFEEQLFEYAQKGMINKIQEIRDWGYDIYIKNKSGQNILIVAIYCENLKLVKYLLSIGFDTKSVDYHGFTILMHATIAASISGKTDILDEIIFNGNIDFTAKNYEELDALDYAKQYGNSSIIKYIQSYYN
jgi:methionyl-tRNA formyltransferase